MSYQCLKTIQLSGTLFNVGDEFKPINDDAEMARLVDIGAIIPTDAADISETSENSKVDNISTENKSSDTIPNAGETNESNDTSELTDKIVYAIELIAEESEKDLTRAPKIKDIKDALEEEDFDCSGDDVKAAWKAYTEKLTEMSKT